MSKLLLTHPTATTKPAKRLQLSALAAAIALPLALGTGPVFADMDKQKDHAYEDGREYTYSEHTDKERDHAYEDGRAYHYPEIKASAKEYWSEFGQDSKQSWANSKEAFRDGWIEGKLETSLILNERLDPFDIDVEVDDAIATLSGEVESDTDKELAGNIALGIEGIDKVQNKLVVVEEMKKNTSKQTVQQRERSKNSDFSQYIADLTTTAMIKSELLSSDNVSGLDVEVDTREDVVTLTGTVESDKQRKMAESVAKKQDDVVKVVNRLKVSQADSKS